MRQPISVLIVLALATLFSGCAGFSEYRKQQNQRRRAEKQPGVTDLNWKQGYGFNNPNNERIQQGLEPVDFDGKTDSQRKSNFANDMIGNLVGDAIGFGIKSAFTTIVDTVKR